MLMLCSFHIRLTTTLVLNLCFIVLPLSLCRCLQQLSPLCHLGCEILDFIFAHLVLLSYDYYMHDEGLLPVSLCSVTLLSSERHLI